MNNVTILNTGIVTLSVNGCFNIYFNKLRCSNLTWKKQALFTFRGSSIKIKNILIENIFSDNNKLEGKALFLIQWCALEIRNVLIKDCKVQSSIRLHKTIAIFLVQNSLVKMGNMKVVGNVLQSFARVEDSSLHISNISSSNNIFTVTLCSVQKSNLTLCNAKFHSNKVRSLIHTTSNVLVTSNILSENKIYKNGYSIVKSIIQLKNTVLKKNNVMQAMLILTSSSSAIIQNNTLIENNVSEAVYSLFGMSKIQLNKVVFTQNNLGNLLKIQSNSSATIQNNILTENNVSGTVYVLLNMSNIQVNNVAFTQNSFVQLLHLKSNSSATIYYNTFTENNVSGAVYVLFNMSNIQLTNVVFSRNSVMKEFMHMGSNSNGTVKNNTIDGNNMHERVFNMHNSSLSIDTILLYKNKFVNSLISAISSYYVNLDFMRIRENRFESDIILIKNCEGRSANTYIENYDYFSVSAISVTWKDKLSKTYSFYITNNTILWNYELQLLMQSIIKLRAPIKIYNLNISYSSISGIEVLRYSTANVETHDSFGYGSSTYVYRFKHFFISCRRANVNHNVTHGTFMCTPCVRYTYTLNNG